MEDVEGIWAWRNFEILSNLPKKPLFNFPYKTQTLKNWKIYQIKSFLGLPKVFLNQESVFSQQCDFDVFFHFTYTDASTSSSSLTFLFDIWVWLFTKKTVIKTCRRCCSCFWAPFQSKQKQSIHFLNWETKLMATLYIKKIFHYEYKEMI